MNKNHQKKRLNRQTNTGELEERERKQSREIHYEMKLASKLMIVICFSPFATI